MVTPPNLSHPRKLGIMSLMRQPEFAYTEALLPIMQVLEDDTVLLHVLDATAPEDGKVFIIANYTALPIVRKELEGIQAACAQAAEGEE